MGKRGTVTIEQRRKHRALRTQQRIKHMPHKSIPPTGPAYAGTIEDEKFGGRIVYESGEERDALIHIVFEPLVVRLRRNDLTQEERARYRMPAASRANWVLTLEDGRRVEADFLAHLADGRDLLIEVGPHDKKTAPAEAARLRAASIVAASEGAGYVVLTDRMLRSRLLDNRRALYSWLSPVSASDGLVEEAARRFAGARQRPIDDVVEELAGERGEPPDVILEAARAAVARAHRAGRLRAPLDEVIFDLATPCAIVAEPAA